MAFPACGSAKIVGPRVSRPRGVQELVKVVVHEMRHGRVTQTWGGMFPASYAGVAVRGAEVVAQDLREELERETVPAEATLPWRGY